MADDPSTESADDSVTRHVTVALAGHRHDAVTSRAALGDPAPAVRSAGLGALAHAGALRTDDLLAGLGDPAPAVRRRAAELAGTARGKGSRSTLPAGLIIALGDSDALVVEAACWSLGERRVRAAVPGLSRLGQHADARCREAAVAALGAIGDPAGLEAVLARLDDKPTVRRRATVALAAFDGPAVDAALDTALGDRDWQVRQAAASLLGVPEPAK